MFELIKNYAHYLNHMAKLQRIYGMTNPLAAVYPQPAQYPCLVASTLSYGIRVQKMHQNSQPEGHYIKTKEIINKVCYRNAAKSLVYPQKRELAASTSNKRFTKISSDEELSNYVQKNIGGHTQHNTSATGRSTPRSTYDKYITDLKNEYQAIYLRQFFRNIYRDTSTPFPCLISNQLIGKNGSVEEKIIYIVMFLVLHMQMAKALVYFKKDKEVAKSFDALGFSSSCSSTSGNIEPRLRDNSEDGEGR